MKLNLGSNSKRVDGYINVDIQKVDNVDIVSDLTEIPWEFETDSIDHILAQEFLEHLEVKCALPVLKECYRILKQGSSVTIQVPDIEAMCRMIDKQCTCVPQKAAHLDMFKADSMCFQCGGKAEIHPDRWHMAFTGAQKNSFDIHRNHFTYKYLRFLFGRAGFTDIQRTPNIYKLILTGTKPYGNTGSAQQQKHSAATNKGQKD